MRMTSTRRHIMAFSIVLAIFTFIALLPTIIDRVEFYIFQHLNPDYVVEDYNFIDENLTKVELQQMEKQFIPKPSKKQAKLTIETTKPKLTPEQIRNLVPVIVDESEIDDRYVEDLQTDSAPPERKVENKEEILEEDTDDGLYAVVEEMPSFPGGEDGLMAYIYKNLRYPFAAASKNLESTVICTFIIDTKGAVTQAEITMSANPNLDKEALRIVQSLPKWKPARQHGKPIRVKYTLPIVFRLK